MLGLRGVSGWRSARIPCLSGEWIASGSRLGRELLLRLGDELSEHVDRGNVRRSKSIFRDIPPDRRRVERIALTLAIAAIHHEHILRRPHLNLRTGTI